MPSMRKKRQLTNLPNELLIQILSNIHGQNHLAEIALVSKQIKALVEQVLYRHISLDVRYSTGDTGDFSNTSLVNQSSYTTIPSFLPFDRLIERLSVRQDLARLVQRLDLRVRRRLWYMPFAGHSRLLEHLPELRALSLSPPPYDLSIPSSDWTIKSLQLDFSHVTDHYADEPEWLRVGVPLYIIAKHLRLTKLRKLQADTVCFACRFNDARHLPKGSSSVVDLRFLNCFMDKSGSVLASFLRSTKYLERFVVDIRSSTYTAAYTASSPDAYTGAFELALSEHQETVEELAIATSGGCTEIRWPMSPFTQWSSLRLLAMPSYMIRGTSPREGKLHERLPPLLEEFQIEHSMAHFQRLIPQTWFLQPPTHRPTFWPGGNDSEIDAARAEYIAEMRMLAENKEIYVPKLKLVIWWCQTPDHFNCPIDRMLAGLRLTSLAFDGVGVEFKWVTESLFKDTPFGKRLCEWQE